MRLYRLGPLSLLPSAIWRNGLSTVLAGGIFSFPNTRSGVVELLETKSRSTFLGGSTHNKQMAQNTVFFKARIPGRFRHQSTRNFLREPQSRCPWWVVGLEAGSGW